MLFLQLDNVLQAVDMFFNLDPKVKSKYAKKKGTSPNGWDALERERFEILCIFYINYNQIVSNL